MENVTQPKVEKKAYTKPLVTVVRLVAQEAVLGVCKQNNGNKDACSLFTLTCTGGEAAS